MAAVHLAALPLVGVNALLSPEGAVDSLFIPVFAAFCLVAALGVVGVRRGRAGRGWLTAWTVADVLLIALQVHLTGGVESEVRRTLFLPPVAAAFLLGPARTVGVACLTAAAFAGVALADEGASVNQEAAFGLSLAWIGLAAALLSGLVEGRAAALAEVVDLRGRLLARAVDSHEDDRRRIAEQLHDRAVQDLALARQDIAEALEGRTTRLESAARALDDAIAQMREVLSELHPVTLHRGGLRPALETIAERHAARGGYRVELEVDSDVENVADTLVVSLVSELLHNAAKHARASTVEVRAWLDEGQVCLSVRDDGVGMDPRRLEEALAGGHIGLAAADQRLVALGGGLEIESPGRGTAVTARLPVGASADR